MRDKSCSLPFASYETASAFIMHGIIPNQQNCYCMKSATLNPTFTSISLGLLSGGLLGLSHAYDALFGLVFVALLPLLFALRSYREAPHNKKYMLLSLFVAITGCDGPGRPVRSNTLHVDSVMLDARVRPEIYATVALTTDRVGASYNLRDPSRGNQYTVPDITGRTRPSSVSTTMRHRSSARSTKSTC